jgi:hypothetical protein
MVSLTPTERVEFVAKQIGDSETATDIHDFLCMYEHFLDVTSDSEDELIKRFSNSGDANKLRDEQSGFGDLAYKVFHSIGQDSQFYRRIVI